MGFPRFASTVILFRRCSLCPRRCPSLRALPSRPNRQKNKFYGGISAPPNFSNADHKFNHGGAKGQNVFSSFSDVFDDESGGGGGGNGGSRASHSEPPQRKNIPSLLSNLSKPTGLNNSGGNVTKPTEEKVLKSILKTS